MLSMMDTLKKPLETDHQFLAKAQRNTAGCSSLYRQQHFLDRLLVLNPLLLYKGLCLDQQHMLIC